MHGACFVVASVFLVFNWGTGVGEGGTVYLLRRLAYGMRGNYCIPGTWYVVEVSRVCLRW